MNDDDFQRRMEHYRLVHTAVPLFRIFSANESLQRYAVHTSPAEIIHSYYQTAARLDKTIEDVTWCYVCIVALKLTGVSLVDVPGYDLDWVEGLKVL